MKVVLLDEDGASFWGGVAPNEESLLDIEVVVRQWDNSLQALKEMARAVDEKEILPATMFAK